MRRRIERPQAATKSTTLHQGGFWHDSVHSAGRPLDAATRFFMERRFGRDFSDVRVHTDARADAAAAAVDARAFTVGADIVFHHGEHKEQISAVRALMYHDLANTVAQGSLRYAYAFVYSD